MEGAIEPRSAWVLLLRVCRRSCRRSPCCSMHSCTQRRALRRWAHSVLRCALRSSPASPTCVPALPCPPIKALPCSLFLNVVVVCTEEAHALIASRAVCARCLDAPARPPAGAA